MPTYSAQAMDSPLDALNRMIVSGDTQEPMASALARFIRDYVPLVFPPGDLPPGGIEESALIKNSSADFDVGWSANPVTLASATAVDLPDTTFTALGVWYPVVPQTTYQLPPRPANSLLEVIINIHLSWNANSGSQTICDWSIDGGVHFARSFHMLVQKQDNSTLNGIDLSLWQIAQDPSPTIEVVARQVVGNLGLAVVGANNASWPALGSRALILDRGAI